MNETNVPATRAWTDASSALPWRNPLPAVPAGAVTAILPIPGEVIITRLGLRYRTASTRPATATRSDE